MAKTPVLGAVQSDGFAVLTWPQRVVLEDDRPVNYVMARMPLRRSKSIGWVTRRIGPGRRPKIAPMTTQSRWAHLVSTATNLCFAVQLVHRVNAVIGDFQERNILVSDTTRVTLIDCYPMQFIDTDG